MKSGDSILELFSERVKVVHSKKNIYYFTATILIVAFTILFFTSKFYLYDDTPVHQTPLNKAITSLNDTEITPIRWEYNPKNRLMEIELIQKNTSDNPLNATLSYYAKERSGNDILKLKAHQIYKNPASGDTIVEIKNVPTNYQLLGLFINEKAPASINNHPSSVSPSSDGTSGSDSEQVNEKPVTSKLTIYGDYRRVKINSNLKRKTNKAYFENDIKNSLHLQQVKIEQIKKSVAQQDKLIGELNKQIATLKENKSYQTDSDQTQINSQIQQKEAAIKTIQINKDDLNILLTSQKDQLKKIEQQLKKETNGDLVPNK